MIYLILLFVVLFFLYLVEVKKIDTLKPVGIYTIWILFVLVAGLRYRVGGDSLYYQDIYPSFPLIKDLRNYSLYQDGYGPLWYLFCALSKAVSPHFFVLQIIHAAIINTAVFYFFIKYSRHLFTCLLIYYVFYYLYFNMEILRESLAISVFLFNIKNLMGKKWFLYYMGCVVSLAFHLSAIILFLLPFLSVALKKKYIKISLAACFAMILGLLYILKNEVTALFFLPSILLIKIHSYGTREMNNLNGIIFNMMPFLSFFVFFLLHYWQGRKNRDMRDTDSIETLFRVFLLLAFFGGFNEGIFRFTNYLTPLAIVYAVNLSYDLYEKKFKMEQMMISMSLLIFCLYKFAYYYRDTSDLADHTRRYELWYPYESILTQERHPERELIFYNATHNLIDLRKSNQ